jgi:hypothetical protein
MNVINKILKNTPDMEMPARDDLTATIGRDWNDLFGMDPAAVAAFQLAGLRRRFAEQLPKLKSLRAQVESTDVTSIDRLEDVVPLLFQDSVYKSYPMALIEKNRFDLLTKWLSGYTTLDLTHADTSACDGVDSWIDTLEAQTALRSIHTSGTSGKLSFFPRSTVEIETWYESYMKSHEGFGAEPGIRLGHAGDVRMPVVFPIPRHGRYVAQRNLRFLETRVTPTPEQLYTLTNGELSADLVSLSGRIRVAQAKGEVSRLQLSETLRAAMRRYLEELERRPAETAEFFRRIVDELQGQRVFVSATSNILYEAAVAGLERGMRNVFAPDSIGMSGGGGKGIVLPDNWLDVLREFTGIQNWTMTYGMSEMVGVMPMGDPGWYHVPPYLIPFLLDPESGALLPRAGVVTGRFAFHDLLAQTNWGGIITGDKVTIDWDGASPSGRKAPRIRADIERYAAAVTGEDKVTCAATVDNTDAALQSLLGI